MSGLAVREGKNYQFDFLKPSHSLYYLFNRLVEQYRTILTPPKEKLEGLKRDSEDKFAVSYSLNFSYH